MLNLLALTSTDQVGAKEVLTGRGGPFLVVSGPGEEDEAAVETASVRVPRRAPRQGLTAFHPQAQLPPPLLTRTLSHSRPETSQARSMASQVKGVTLIPRWGDLRSFRHTLKVS